MQKGTKTFKMSSGDTLNIVKDTTRLGVSMGKLSMLNIVENTWKNWMANKTPVYTYKKKSINVSDFMYDVFYKGQPYCEYSSPSEKVIVMLVEALEKGHRTGGLALIDSILTDIKENITKDE